VPEIEIRGNDLDPIRILSLMHFPNDEALRQQYLAVKATEWELGRALTTDLFKIEVSRLQTLLESPGKAQLREITDSLSKRAFVAGDYLLNICGMHSFPEYFDEPSERKAVFLAERFANETEYKDGSSLPADRSSILRIVKEFRDVAHLWAAWRFYEIIPGRNQEDFLMGAQSIREFLGIARSLQEFGCSFVPKRSRSEMPILNNKTIWTVPDSIPHIELSWPLPPPHIIEHLKSYKTT